MQDGAQCVVNKRPGLDRFLRDVCADTALEVHVFTAGMELYASPLLDTLERTIGVSFRRRHYRDSCTVQSGYYLKDLTKVGRPSLARVVLVDNSPISFVLQPENGIPVKSFYSDAADTQLEFVGDLLRTLKHEPDVRPALAKLFQLTEKIEPWRSQVFGAAQFNPNITPGRGSRL